MTPKRNDPCHCGSGKKYKHCHRKEDLAKEKAEDSKPVFVPMPSPIETLPPLIDDIPPINRRMSREMDSELARHIETYDAFEEADYEGKIAIMRTALEEQSLDHENAFEFFNELYPHMVERGERAKFDELVALFRTNQPDAYRMEAHWFWEWEVANALALEDDDALQQATDRLVINGAQEPEVFAAVFNGLLYHDRRDVLLNAITKLTAEIDAGNYFVNEEYELNEKFGKLIVLNYIETHDLSSYLTASNIKALCTQAVTYIEELTLDGLKQYISWVGGLTKGQWTLDNFKLEGNFEEWDWVDDDWYNEKMDGIVPALAHLRDLGYGFLHYARHVENIPLTKADLVREHMIGYIIERSVGELIPGYAANVLLPDHASLQAYLPRFRGFMGDGMYAGAALFELVPTWVRFLQSKELVTEAEGKQALKSMQALSQSMMKLMDSYEGDPTLGENMQGLGRDC